VVSGFNKPFDIRFQQAVENKPSPALGASFAGAQIWECVDCRTERQWGCGQPGDKLEVMWLMCEGICVGDSTKNDVAPYTRHTFVRVKAGW